MRSTYPRGSTLGPLCLSFPEDCGGSGGRRPTDVPSRNRVMAKSRGKCSVRRFLVSSERNISVKPHVIYERRKIHSRTASCFQDQLANAWQTFDEKKTSSKFSISSHARLGSMQYLAAGEPIVVCMGLSTYRKRSLSPRGIISVFLGLIPLRMRV